MPKSFWIFTQLILIFKIVFSTQWTTIEMENLKSTNSQNVNLNNFFSLTHFGSTNVQPKFKLNNLLIFLSSDKFKYCILPYLSSHNLVKVYLYFQNLIPELNFHKFLPPSRFYTTNNVLDIQEPTTFLQPLEINFLYQFNGEYSSLKPHILYFFKNEIPHILKPDTPIPPDSICALLSHNKILPYKTYVNPTSHQELLILKDDKSDQFFVTFQKSTGEFINIAKGSGVSEKEFTNYVDCIWEAYNLQGWKKYYWKMKSFFTRTYVKYIFYVVKIISCLDCRLLLFLDILYNYLQMAANSDNLMVHFFGFLLFLLIYVPYIFMIAALAYTACVLCYYATLIPFFVLALPLKHFVFGFNVRSFWYLSQGLASLYVCFFPEIKKCMHFSMAEMEKIELSDILPRIIKSFEIKPKSIMSVVPLLVRNRKNRREECLDTFFMWCLIYLFSFMFSPVFVLNGIYF